MTDQVERLTSALAGRYLIAEEIGSGGMATVFLAEDVKHERKVALKVLKPELAAVLGGERFVKEIKLTARLNHPHILPLLDSGEADHVLFYVMPYVAGESLRQTLNRETQVSVDDAVRLVHQVASALQHAHELGVVHRDIKPENILLNHGEAMVADFGIALALNVAGGDRLTETGLSIGTPAYMSPEQASGEMQLDARSDVYSLGCVLHEILTGDPPFIGQTPQAIIARQVLDPPPSIRTVRSSVSAELEQVVRRALAKAPTDRWQSAKEFATQLEAAKNRPEDPVSSPRAPGRPVAFSLQAVLGIGAALIAAVVVVATVILNNGPSAVPAPNHSQLTFSGNLDRVEISPDGELLSYVEAGDPARLLVRDLRGETNLELADIPSTGLSTFRWSPDGSSHLLHYAYNEFREFATVLYPRLGGTPRTVSQGFAHEPSTVAGYGILSPDGAQVASWWQNRSSIQFLTLATGDTTSVHTPDSVGSFLFPGDWSPDGRFIALSTSTSPTRYALWALELVTSRWHHLTHDSVYLSPPRWSHRSDAIYFLRGKPLQQVLRLRIGSNGLPRGVGQVLDVGTIQTHFTNGLLAQLSVSGDSRKLVYVRGQPHSNVMLATFTEQNEDTQSTSTMLTRGTALRSTARFSPDGAWIAYVERRGMNGDVFIVPSAGGEPRPMTFAGQALAEVGVAWSPDGDRLVFGVLQGVRRKVQTVRVDGGEVRTYQETELGEGGVAWAPNQRILYSRAGNRNVQLLDAQSEIENPLAPDVGWIFKPIYSPDGRRVAVQWNRQRPGVWVISLDDGSQTLIHAGFEVGPSGWTADGRSVYLYQPADRQMLRIPSDGGEASTVATLSFENADQADTDCVPFERGNQLELLCTVTESVRDAWMIENFDAGHQ